MHFPLQIGYGEFRINAHLLFETLAFIIGFRYFLYLRIHSADHIHDSNRTWIIIGAALGAFFFSRLIGSFENPPLLLESHNKLLFIFSNKTIVGGLIGGLIGVEFVKALLHETRSSGDLFTYPLILAMIIGRIGCFCSGVFEEAYGKPTTSFIGMDLGDGVPRHPVMLYEIAFLILLFITLKIIERRNTLKDGYQFQLFMTGYLSFRLLEEFIKPDYYFFWHIGTIQLTCIAGLIYYHKIILKIISNPLKLYANAR